MGLAGRKEKQRIASDPRNLTWADDAAKFGQQYLTRLGWDPSRGLGVSGDGRTSHIKVAQKLNLLGIGVAGAKGMGDETVAWKQNRDYEMLLKRLNEGLETNQEKAGETEKAKKDEESVQDEDVPKKKRKRDGNAIIDADDDEERKKRKKEKKDRKEKKKKKKKKDNEEKAERKSDKEKRVKEEDKDKEAPNKPEPTEASPSNPIIQAPIPRPMAHRARFLRSKQLASRDSSAVAEILGISTSTSNSPGPSSLSATPFPASSESQMPVPETNHDLQTSSKSVGDYFKEKLAARVLDREKSSTPRPSAVSASSSVPFLGSTPVREDVANVPRPADGYEMPRAGLGSRTTNSLGTGTNGGETPRAGLGVKFSSLMGGFSSSEVVSTARGDLPKNEEPLLSILPEATEGTHGEERASEKRKKTKKAEDRKKGKERKERIKSVPDVANNATSRAAQSAIAAGTDRSTEVRVPREKVGRKEKKKRKEKKEKRQVDAC